jgi:hypothetical protein
MSKNRNHTTTHKTEGTIAPMQEKLLKEAP